MPTGYTERDTEEYYDAEDVIYRSLWDAEGSVHWGLFDETTGSDFLKACDNLNRMMAEKARVDNNSRLLDLGCGSGTTSLRLSKRHGCHVVGVDISGVRIGNATDSLASEPEDIRTRVRFQKASATELPFEDASFSHIWSQAVLYHIHDSAKALAEAYRVLKPAGVFVFDDLLKPKPEVSQSARTYVYDRLFFDTDYNFQSYQDALTSAGFKVLEAQDLSQHLKTSYARLADMAREKTGEHVDKFQALAVAYGKTVQAVEDGELGWALYLCQK